MKMIIELLNFSNPLVVYCDIICVLFTVIYQSKFTPLGAISLDSDVRYLMTFAKDCIDSPELKSNVSLCKSCPALGCLNQIALLLNVIDLDDALNLISVNKRKGNWDLKLDDAKTVEIVRSPVAVRSLEIVRCW